MQLTGNGFILRAFEKKDSAGLARHANNEKIAANLRDVFPHPYTPDDADAFIGYILSHNDPVTHFVIEVQHEAAGVISIFLKSDVYRQNAEIGYWLGEEHWNKGIITAAIRLVTAYVFSHFDVVRIYAQPFATSQASARALEKAGYTREATLVKSITKNGQLLDSYIYSIVKA